jgi:ubiquinone/menaquinone biosynthesis C-methylase UbiE
MFQRAGVTRIASSAAAPGAHMATYSLGHSSTEQERLQAQAQYTRDITWAIWREAGIAAGMSVIDVGCGVGDTTFLAAELVGPTGSVIGVDRSAEALETARQRAQSIGLNNVQFVEGDIHSLRPNLKGAFDAVVGRLVLIHQADIVLALRSLRQLARPGGLLAFHEYELQVGFSSDPRSSLVATVVDWLRDACRAAGMQPTVVSQMPRYFYEAGLGWPSTRLHTLVSSGPHGFGPGYLANSLRSLAPVLERAGIASSEEVGLGSLEARLRESCANGEVSCAIVNGGSWAHVAA